MQDDPFTSTNALRSLIWMINSKYASQYNQMICYLCYYWNTRWVLEIRPVPGGYGYKILPASRTRVKNFTRGHPMGTRNTKNNLVNSYHSQILCLIFLWLYELTRWISRLCELIDWKWHLHFAIICSEAHNHCYIF